MVYEWIFLSLIFLAFHCGFLVIASWVHSLFLLFPLAAFLCLVVCFGGGGYHEGLGATRKGCMEGGALTLNGVPLQGTRTASRQKHPPRIAGMLGLDVDVNGGI